MDVDCPTTTAMSFRLLALFDEVYRFTAVAGSHNLCDDLAPLFEFAVSFL